MISTFSPLLKLCLNHTHCLSSGITYVILLKEARNKSFGEVPSTADFIESRGLCKNIGAAFSRPCVTDNRALSPVFCCAGTARGLAVYRQERHGSIGFPGVPSLRAFRRLPRSYPKEPERRVHLVFRNGFRSNVTELLPTCDTTDTTASHCLLRHQ